MYYRGSRVPLTEKSPRFSTAGTSSYSLRFRAPKEEKKNGGFFEKWAGKKGGTAKVPEKKTYAFYRPGRTQVDDTPAFSDRKRAWVPKTTVLSGASWVLKCAGVVLLMVLVVWSKNKTTALLQDVAGLKLEKVTVDGNHYLTEDEIVKAAALPLGESMFKLDLNGALEKVKGLDWVDRVFIERRLPRSIVISVRERKPAALLDRGELYGVDNEGRVLPSAPALLREDLPLISGLSASTEALGTTKTAEALKPALEAIAFLQKKDPVLAQDISEINLSEAGSVKVTFIDGIQATFAPPIGEEDLRRMALVLSDLNGKGKRAAAMDFRYRDMVLVKTREGK
jgi:cell division protein FtsQ